MNALHTLQTSYPKIKAEVANICPQDAPDYLTDESRMHGQAERIYLPRTEDEVLTLTRMALDSGKPLTVSGGRTGITGGAVPQNGWLMSTEHMNTFTGLRCDKTDKNVFYLRCQPGLALSAVNEAVASLVFPGAENWPENDRQALDILRQAPPLCFPPDPTEHTASLGGMVACNASGARTLLYGATRKHITGLRMALADGSLLALQRGTCHATPDGIFTLVGADNKAITGKIPAYTMPAVKNAAGYYSAPGMDMIDLFIGAEGTLGIFTEIEIKLIPAPAAILGAVAFFPGEDNALQFVRQARAATLPDNTKLLALEFFDHRALDLLRDQKERQGAGSPIPTLPPNSHTAIYVEFATTETAMEDAAEMLLDMLEKCGSDPDYAWTAMDDDESLRLKNFRHALPEAVNQRIGERAAHHPGLTKLGTDLAVPDNSLPEMLEHHHAALQEAGFEYVIFGHIGNNHLHANILPRDMNEYNQGKELYLKLARAALDHGGTVSAEHGIGKLKKTLLEMMYGADGIQAMRAVKQVFDPHNRINPGNMT